MSGSFIRELRNRKVLRTGLIYCSAAFACLEFLQFTIPRICVQDSVLDTALILFVAGLPVAMILSWFLDATNTEQGEESSISWFNIRTIAVAAFLVAIGVVAGTQLGSGLDGDTQEESAVSHGVRIAVLPFQNISGDEGKDYFSDGLSEDISTALSRFSDLQVIPSRLTQPVRDTPTVAKAGRELGAAYVIAGSVRLADNAVRVSARLIDASDGNQLWAENYDRALTAANLFEVQDGIARRVVGTLADATGVLTRVGQEKMRQQPTDNLQAYDCVLRSYAYLTIHDDETHSVARDCLERAIGLDPDYSDAYAHLAYLYREEYHHNRNKRPEPLQRAVETAEHAINLNPANSMAHYAMAMTRFSMENLTVAMAQAERAISLNPNDATYLAAFSIYFAFAGDLDRGLSFARQAQDLNPMAPDWIYMTYASVHYQRGEYQQCLDATARWTQGRDAQWHFHKIAALGQLGRLEEAEEALQMFLRSDSNFAADPIGELRRYLLSEATVEKYRVGLEKAGLTMPGVTPPSSRE